MTTITVATYLVANRNVSADAITALTRTLFQERQAVSGEAPIANLLKAASTEKDAVYPLHPGAKVYYGGEETSWMERRGPAVLRAHAERRSDLQDVHTEHKEFSHRLHSIGFERGYHHIKRARAKRFPPRKHRVTSWLGGTPSARQ